MSTTFAKIAYICLTVALQLLRYLKQADLPCTNQTNAKIKQAMRDLASVEPLPEEEGSRGSNALTKTEKLMLINLAPQALVDLTVVRDRRHFTRCR